MFTVLRCGIIHRFALVLLFSYVKERISRRRLGFQSTSRRFSYYWTQMDAGMTFPDSSRDLFRPEPETYLCMACATTLVSSRRGQELVISVSVGRSPHVYVVCFDKLVVKEVHLESCGLGSLATVIVKTPVTQHYRHGIRYLLFRPCSVRCSLFHCYTIPPPRYLL